MGVWIETVNGHALFFAEPVTPCVGVWIETLDGLGCYSERIVTPCVGVWIETDKQGTEEH